MDKTRIFFFFSWGDFWDFREMQRLTCFETFYKGLAKEEGENQTDPASRLKQSKHNTIEHRKLSKKRRKCSNKICDRRNYRELMELDRLAAGKSRR